MKALRATYGEQLIALAEADPRLVVIDPDVGNSTKADLFGDAIPDRFFSVGIAEQNAVGMAAGLADTGFVPWLSTFSPFLSHRAIDQVRIMVAQSQTNVKLAGAYSGLLTGATGRTHQDVQDIAIMRAMPGMTLLSPADPYELEASMAWAQSHEGPVYFRIARDPEESIFDDSYSWQIGQPITLRTGAELLLVSTGVQTVRCTQAADILKFEGINVGVLHIPSLKPLDHTKVLTALLDYEEIVTVEEHSVIGGLGGLIAEIISSERHHGRLTRKGLADVWTESASNEFLLNKHGLSVDALVDDVTRLLSRR